MRPCVGARPLLFSLLLLSTAAWPLDANTSAAGKAAAAALKRDFARCRGQADLDACYDAVRWNPGDPALLVALADAEMRAQHPADAVRSYRRAAALAPDLPGLGAKIGAAEKSAAKRGRGGPTIVAKRYSNAAPESQSH